jgi:hypothetical protein
VENNSKNMRRNFRNIIFFKILLTPKVLRGQILAFVGFGHVAMIRCDMIFWEFYSR